MLSACKDSFQHRSSSVVESCRPCSTSSAQAALRRVAVCHKVYGCASMSSNAGECAPIVFVIMGVSGCGKSTVGALLADKLRCPFYDADDYHPAENIRKMASGVPLTDDDRWPWLQRLAEIIHQHVQQSTHVVLACSALKPAYRQVLRGAAVAATAQLAKTYTSVVGELALVQDGHVVASAASSNPGQDTGHAGTKAVAEAAGTKLQELSSLAFVLLNPSRTELLQRVQQRATSGKHFMPPSLLDDQLNQLEYDESELFMCFSGSCCSSTAGMDSPLLIPQLQQQEHSKDHINRPHASACGHVSLLPASGHIVDAILQRLQALQ